MNKNDQEFIIQKIRTQYTEKEDTGLDELNKLDSKVKRPANVFAYVFGCISTIIIIGVIGILFTCVAYPVYNYIIRTERKKIAPEIIRLTDELMKQEAKMNVKGESKTKLWTFK